MKSKYRIFLIYFIPLFISAAVCMIMSLQIRQVALSHTDNVTSFYSYTNGLAKYKMLRQEWRPRIASNFLAGQFINLFNVSYSSSLGSDAMKAVFANWTAIWLFLCCVVFVLLFREWSLLYIFGVFAGVLFAYTLGIGTMRVYPWDMPTLFVFCCFITLIKTKHEAWLPVFIPIAMLFKETAVVMVIALLFWQGVTWRRKMLYTAITLFAGLGLKLGVDLLTNNPSPLFTMTYRDTVEMLYSAIYEHNAMKGGNLFSTSLLWSNLRKIFTLRLDSPFFIDAGLLVALLLLPIRKRTIAMLKSVAVAFIIGNLLFGVIVEYRIWFEMIPLALYALHLYFYEAERINAPIPAT